MTLVLLKKSAVINEIIPGLYLGDVDAASPESILKNGIQVVVNISNSRYPECPDVQYHHLDIVDDRRVDISCFYQWFIDIINENMNKNKKILVHCRNSVSRSVSFVLVYLVSTGMTLRDALIYLKSNRSQYSRPNVGFARQLVEYEMSVHGKTTISVMEIINSYNQC